jgi:hypothetical protein
MRHKDRFMPPRSKAIAATAAADDTLAAGQARETLITSIAVALAVLVVAAIAVLIGMS